MIANGSSSIGPGEGSKSQSAQNGSFNNGFGTGANLRGLGAASTLTLINGRRIAPAGYGSFADIGAIPLAAIERVEILPDGSSAVYGSDAVGGVINFILRKDFDGVELRVRGGGGDGFQTNQQSVVAGTKWSSGSIVASYERTFRTSLNANERSYYTNNLTPFGGHDYRNTYSSPGTLSVGGGNYALPVTANGTGIVAANLVRGTTNLGDSLAGADILPRQLLNSAFLSAHQDLSSSLTLYVDGTYSERSAFANYSGTIGGVSVPSTNPFFVSPVAGASTVTVFYNFGKDGLFTRNASKSRDYSANGGLNARLRGDWEIDVSGSYAHHSEDDDYLGYYNGATAAPFLALTDPATALNVFGSGGAISAATLAAIQGYSKTQQNASITSARANLNGTVLSIPGGAVRAAFGAEYRHEAFAQQGQALFFGTSPTLSNQALSRNVLAFYGELIIPLVGPSSEVPLLRSLELSAAARYEHYSDFGDTTTPRFGASWEPVRGLKFRASYGRSFQAPLLYNLGSRSPRYTLYQNQFVDSSSPTGFTNVIVYSNGGNPSLQPQRATTWSAGADISPAVLPTFTVSINYFNIKYRDLIATIPNTALFAVLNNQNVYGSYTSLRPTQSTLDAIYASGYYSGTQLPAGQVGAIVNSVPTNVGLLTEDGLDFAAKMGVHTGFGEIGLNANLSYVFNYKVAQASGIALQQRVGTIDNPVRFRGRGGITWTKGALESAITINYVDSYQNNAVTPLQNVSSWTTFDAHFGWRLPAIFGAKNLLLGFDAVNVFNRKPPFVDNPVGYGYNPSYSNALGRQLNVELRARF